MKPSNYIFNTDTQSLGNYLDGSGSLSVSSGQVINGPAILDSIIVSAVEDRFLRENSISAFVQGKKQALQRFE